MQQHTKVLLNFEYGPGKGLGLFEIVQVENQTKTETKPKPVLFSVSVWEVLFEASLKRGLIFSFGSVLVWFGLVRFGLVRFGLA